MAERQILFDAIFVRRMHRSQTAKSTAAFGHFRLRQVAPAGARAQHFSTGRNLEPFDHGLPGFDAFGTSHKSTFSKKSAQYREQFRPAQAIISRRSF
jgi:hypothetical protein